jgi:FAD synthase
VITSFQKKINISEQGDEDLFLVDFDRKFSESKKDDFIELSDNNNKYVSIGFTYDTDAYDDEQSNTTQSKNSLVKICV